MVKVPVKLPLLMVIAVGVVWNIVLDKASMIVTFSPLHVGGKLAPVIVMLSPACAYDCDSEIPGPHSAGGWISRLILVVLLIDGSAHDPSTFIWYISEDAHSATVMESIAEAVSPLTGVTLLTDRLRVTPGAVPALSATTASKPLIGVM